MPYFGVHNALDTTHEHWRYITLIVCFTAIALTVPTLFFLRVNTRRNLAEAALRENEERFRAVMDASPAAIFLKDLEGRFLLANDRYETWCGVTEGAKGRTVYDFFPKEQADIFASQDREVIESGKTKEYELDTCVPGNGSITVNAVKFPIFGPDHKVTGVGGIYTNISERKKAENALIEEMDNAIHASQAKSNFLAHMSHELRTPLNSILGFSQMMMERVFGPLGNKNYEEYAEDIHTSGTHLLSLINDVLDLSKIEAGRIDVCPEEIDLSQLIASSLDVVKEQAMTERKTLYAEISENLPHLLADKRMVKQMLLNLLSNAVKFTPEEGRITVGADVTEDGGFSLIVSDTGIGIPKDQIALVKAPFGQIDSSLSRSHKGTGLGIPLVKELIELHEGTLEVESLVDIGTKVTLHFPPERVVYPA